MDYTRRQGEILEAASKLLLKKGIQGFTTKNLALQMKFSEAALYRHFSNKEGIIIAMLTYIASIRYDMLLTAIEEEKNSSKKLKAVYGEIFKFYSKNKHYTILAFPEGLWEGNKQIQECVSSNSESLKKFFSTIVTEGVAEGKFSKKISKESLIQIVVGTYKQQLLEWKMDNFKSDINASGKSLVKDVIKLIK